MNANTGSSSNSGSNVATPEEEAEQALLSDLKSLEADLARQRDLYVRLAADFDNFRKRTAQETERRASAQKEAFVRELLPVIDNLERALASDKSTSPEHLREGVQMTLQQFRQLLSRHGIEPEEGLGQPFDPHRQEAVATRRDEAQPDLTVLDVFQRGYRRGEESFRPAKVVVNDLGRAEAAPDKKGII